MSLELTAALTLAALCLVVLGVGAREIKRRISSRALEAEQLRRVYDALSWGVIVQDAAGKLVHANQAARVLLGTTDVVLAGSPDADHRVVHEDGTSAQGEAYPLGRAL